MSSLRSELAQVVLGDKRYAPEAYEFLWQSLTFTQEMLGKTPPTEAPDKEADEESEQEIRHVTGRELLDGVRRLALEQFGRMSAVVFRMWGVRSTSDFGAMVYRLIDAGIWHCSATDRKEDFDDAYDFDKAFVQDYCIEWDDDENAGHE
jgi:uncharacterized repeat protein (TIGR04138 family)